MRNGVSHVREIARMSLKLMEAVKVMVIIISETVETAMIMVQVSKVEVVLEVVVKEGQDIVWEEKVIYFWLECRLLSAPFLLRTLVIQAGSTSLIVEIIFTSGFLLMRRNIGFQPCF